MTVTKTIEDMKAWGSERAAYGPRIKVFENEVYIGCEGEDRCSIADALGSVPSE